jgi:hypothetical protein
MPFKSEAQRAFMYSKHPAVAREFEAATAEGAKLPPRAPASAVPKGKRKKKAKKGGRY